jgi:hypothetical protein
LGDVVLRGQLLRAQSRAGRILDTIVEGYPEGNQHRMVTNIKYVTDYLTIVSLDN